MRKYFCEQADISDNKITISAKGKVHHIKDVLRMKEGDSLIISDKEGRSYITKIEGISEQTVVLAIKEYKAAAPAQKVFVAVACALPKKSRMDDIIDKLTQLGVDRIIPLQTTRVIVKLDKKKKALRQARWLKIAQSAAEQSQRNSLPIVDPVRDFKELLVLSKDFDLRLIPALIGERKALKEVLKNTQAKSILVTIGPEGDFSEEEVRLAVARSFIPVTLGDLVLRVETAAVAVASYIRFYLNEDH
jgi:16S rRNA (uracil1498-N3)-methyltransferase